MGELYHVVNTERTGLGRFAIRLDTVEKEGREYPCSFVEAKDSVAVLAKAGERFVLLCQYRHSIRKYVLEIPGGSIEAGEDPAEAAERELLEETGYEAETVVPLGSFYPSPGSSCEQCHLYYAECGSRTGQRLEPLEYAAVVLADAEELEQKISSGEFVHGMGLAAWLKYRLAGRGQDADRKDKDRF